MLHLFEEVMLLALRDKQGTIVSGTRYEYATSGAILAELLLTKRIHISHTRKKAHVGVMNPSLTGDLLLDQCLETIRNSKKVRSLEDWVSRFAGIKHLKHRIAARLCSKGILRADEKKVMLLFTQKIYPEVNPEPEREVIEKLRRAIFEASGSVEERTSVLVSLANATGLLEITFGAKALKTRQRRIEEITHGEVLGQAARDAIEAVETAQTITSVVTTIT